MSNRFRRWWPFLKAVLLIAVVLGVGWHLLRILENEELGRTDASRSPARILWDEMSGASLTGLVLCGLLYLIALGFSAAYWIWLVRSASETLPVVPGVRGYYLSHLGKYVPGKGWALLMRMSMAADAGCRPAPAFLTSVYETLVTMAAGALVAAALLLVQGGDEGMLWKAGALLVLAGVPILPGVFNRVVERIAGRFQRVGLTNLPKPGHDALLAGLPGMAVSWFVLGASLEALLWAMGAVEPFDLHNWFRSTAFVAVSYVAAFIASTPGGLGVREFLLAEMLLPQLGPRAVVAALLLRLLWTLAELVMAGVVVWFPRTVAHSSHRAEGDPTSALSTEYSVLSTQQPSSPLPCREREDKQPPVAS